jgi:hypothetical protein
MKELWRDVVSYEGLYIVSNFGRVRRIKQCQGTHCKILAQGLDESGYPLVWLSKENKCKKKRVHRLVCEAFHGPKPSSKHEVNHIDGIKTNCISTNLEWLTRRDNVLHTYRSLGREGYHTKNWLVTNPEGLSIKIRNLDKFCKANGLSSSAMCEVAKGKWTFHKRWKCSHIP